VNRCRAYACAPATSTGESAASGSDAAVQPQLEEDDRVDRWAATFLIGLADQLAEERKVELSVELAVEMVRRDERLDREVAERGEGPLLDAHHGRWRLLPGKG
jgi:hypothetical protein